MCYSRPTVYAYLPNFVSIGLFCRPLAAKNPQFLPVFGLRHLVMSTIGINLRKLNTGTQLQTFPNGIKIVSVLQRLHGDIGRTISDVQKRVEQRDRQTNRHKNATFLATPAAGEIRTHQTWHGDRGPRARSCTSKTFGGLTQSFAARGR